MYYLDQLLCLFSFNLLGLINLLYPSVLLEKEKLCYSFQGQDMKDEFFCFDNVSIYFFSNTCKKVLKMVRNLFGICY